MLLGNHGGAAMRIDFGLRIRWGAILAAAGLIASWRYLDKGFEQFAQAASFNFALNALGGFLLAPLFERLWIRIRHPLRKSKMRRKLEYEREFRRRR